MLFDRKTYVALSLITTLFLLGCSDQPESNAKAVKATEHAESKETVTSAGHSDQPAEKSNIKGTVVETFNSGGYTYMKLDTGEGEAWAAIMETAVKEGESVELIPGPVMRDFHSKTLDRTFSEIIFSSGLKGGSHNSDGMMGASHGQEAAAGDGGESGSEPSFEDALQAEGMGSTAMPMEGGSPEAQSGGSLKAVTSAADIAVEKSSAANGYTIGEIYSKAGELDGKKVQVRGKVMKVSPNIMGKTWIHLQDGTGNAMKNTHDLVFTSQTVPDKGDTVVLEGILAKDRDFGAGYMYEAIVEKAEVVE